MPDDAPQRVEFDASTVMVDGRRARRGTWAKQRWGVRGVAAHLDGGCGAQVLGVNRVDGNVFFITNAVLFDESGFAYAPFGADRYRNAGMVSLGSDWYAFSGIVPQDDPLGFALHPDCLPN